MGNLRAILLIFEVITCLKVNFSKCKLLPVGDVLNLHSLALLLDCSTASLLGVYLGLPLGAMEKSKQLWDPAIERLKRRLATWEDNYLSKSGHLTLIKSTLSNLPMYFLSLFRAPSLVLARLEKILANFLWHIAKGEKKFHLVNECQICQPFEDGGLGIKTLKETNQALLA